MTDNNSTMEPVRFLITAQPEVELPAPAASSADAQICRVETGTAEMAQTSEHSIEQLDPKTPGWIQRYYKIASKI